MRKCAPPFFRGDAGCRSQWQKKRDERGAAVKISSVRRKAAWKFGAPQQGHRPLRRVYKRCDWTWHTIYTYITHIHPQNPRKVCRPQAAKNSNHFSLRHVCRGKIPLRQPVWDFAATRQNYACSRPQTPLAEKSAGIFASKKRDARERLFFAVSM